jgi:hypothetical protein
MDETLHPSTLSEILDRTAQIYRSRFLVFFGIAFFPTATLLVFAGAAALVALRLHPGSGANPFAQGMFVFAAVAGFMLIGLPALLGTTALATAALSHAAARSVFGQPIAIRASYKAVWPRGWRYIGLFVAQFAAVWMVPFMAWSFLIMIAAGLAALAQSAGGGLFVFATLLVVLGLVCYGFWMALRLSLGFPACVVEHTGAWAALKRSWSLGNGTRGRILVLYLLGGALNWILSFAIWVPFVVLIQFIPGADSLKHQQTFTTLVLLVVYGAGFAVQAFTRPLYAIALIVFYYDQRIRQEGFDIEWMMLKAGLMPPSQPQPAQQPQPWAQAVAAIGSERAHEAISPQLSAPDPTAPNPLQPASGDHA